jgi:hypothetical protein
MTGSARITGLIHVNSSTPSARHRIGLALATASALNSSRTGLARRVQYFQRDPWRNAAATALLLLPMPCATIFDRCIVASASFVRAARDLMYSSKLRILTGLIVSPGFAFRALPLLLDDALWIVGFSGLVHVNLLLESVPRSNVLLYARRGTNVPKLTCVNECALAAGHCHCFAVWRQLHPWKITL